MLRRHEQNSILAACLVFERGEGGWVSVCIVVTVVHRQLAQVQDFKMGLICHQLDQAVRQFVVDGVLAVAADDDADLGLANGMLLVKEDGKKAERKSERKRCHPMQEGNQHAR